jgi:ankyrin repeat protein
VAAAHGHPILIEALISRKAAVDSTNMNGATALHYAASNGHESVVRRLLRKHAQIDPRDSNQCMPMLLLRTHSLG